METETTAAMIAIRRARLWPLMSMSPAMRDATQAIAARTMALV
ncbi:MAG TPA: hypothetical protein VMI10_06650 [Terriglobales bacterium]|nr:hypothetical protein [Terriglobales bacterium]